VCASRSRAEGEPECTPGAQSVRLSLHRYPGTLPRRRVRRSVPARATQIGCRLSSPASETGQCRWLRCFSGAGRLSIQAFQRTWCFARMIPGPLSEKNLHLGPPKCVASPASNMTIPERKINQNGCRNKSAGCWNKSSMVRDPPNSISRHPDRREMNEIIHAHAHRSADARRLQRHIRGTQTAAPDKQGSHLEKIRLPLRFHIVSDRLNVTRMLHRH
jgi:hypothetical protein